jgi:hypothetical protein
MEKYIFLTKVQQDTANTEYFAIPESQIEEMYVSDTYSMYGNQTTPSEAGDYLELLTEKAVSLANKAYHDEYADYDDTEIVQHFSIGCSISAYDYSQVYDNIVSSQLQEDEDYVAFKNGCQGFNYWNGQDWNTILVQHDDNDVLDWQIVKDKKLIKRLRIALTAKSYKSKGAGVQYYEYGHTQITESFWEGSWESFKLTVED